MKANTHFAWKVILVVLLLSVTGLVGYQVSLTHKTGSVTVKKNDESSKRLNNNLTRKSNLNAMNLSAGKQERLSKLNKKYLNQNKVIGAVVGVENNNVAFSWQNGYANAQLSNIFRMDSNFLVGNYQSVLDVAMILDLASSRKINLTQSMKKYSVKEPNLTIKKFLLQGTKLYIKKENISDFLNAKSKSHADTFLTYKKKIGMVSADKSIRKKIIMIATGSSYTSAVNKLLVAQLGLSGTRVYEAADSQADDVVGYRYYRENGVNSQSKPITISKSYDNYLLLRMSIADMVISVNGILQNKVFNSTYTRIFTDSVKKLSGNSISSELYEYSGNTFGQYLKIKSSKNGKKIIVFVNNFPNKSVSETELLDQFYSLL